MARQHPTTAAKSGSDLTRLKTPLPGFATSPATGRARLDRIALLADLAFAQEGVVTYKQLRETGWTRHQVAHEIDVQRWSLATPHVVVLQNGPLTPRQMLWLGVLHAGAGAALSHRTACAESGLVGWESPAVEVITSKSERIPPLPGFFFHETRRDYRPWLHPTARPSRLRLDHAALLSAERLNQRMSAVGLIAACVQQRLTTAERLFVASREISKLRHGKILRAALGDIAGGAHSFAEIEVGRLCRAAGLAPPQRQTIRVDQRGRRRYLDCEWELPDGRVVVLEIDGGFHLEPVQWWRDMSRERAIVISQRLVLRCSSIEIRLDPDAIINDLRSIGVPAVTARAAA